MKTETIGTTSLTEDDARLLESLDFAAYGPHEQRADAFASVTWAPPAISVLVRREKRGDIVAHAGISIREGLLNRAPVLIGGIGEVKTHPEVRGQRLGKAVVTEAMHQLRDVIQVDFGLLVCLDDVLSYYRQLGWETFDGELWAKQPEGRIRLDTFSNVLVMTGRRPAPSGGVIDLLGLPW